MSAKTAYPQNPYDHNTLGQVGQHNAATVCLPARATGCGVYNGVSQLDVLNFSTLRFELMVGISGGVPSEENDIRLGDVAVSHPHCSTASLLVLMIEKWSIMFASVVARF